MESKLIEIFNTIKSKKKSTPIEKLVATDKLRDDFGFDSLDLAELTVRIENEFDVDIFEDGLVETVDEILQKLEKK